MPRWPPAAARTEQRGATPDDDPIHRPVRHDVRARRRWPAAACQSVSIHAVRRAEQIERFWLEKLAALHGLEGDLLRYGTDA
jgi:hypothetical protein